MTVEGNVVFFFPDNSNKKRIVLHSEPDLLGIIANLSAEIQTLKSNQGTQQRGGSTYVRWGRKSCPGNGTEQVYSGYAAGSFYTNTGAAANYLCLVPDPNWGIYTDAVDAGAKIYGAEYEFWNYPNTDKARFANQRNTLFFGKSVVDDNVPCSVCRSSRSSVLMMPGRNTCYKGWHLEYAGYLTAGAHAAQAATEYVCMDAHPETLPSGFANENGALFFFVEGICGSLECPPYENGRELTCAVCIK